jgi:hypothetical protein
MQAPEADRRRWPMLVIGGIVAGLVVLAVVAIVVGWQALVATPEGSSSAPPDGGASAPEAAASAPAAAPSGQPDGVVDASSFEWASAEFIPPPPGRQMPSAYSLQGGTLAEPDPLLDIVVPLALTDAQPDLGRTPMFAEPARGAVVYVADDGARSQIRRATLARPTADELILELDEVVWAIAVTPDGGDAYALLAPRGEVIDAGVIRVALDGSGHVEQVMAPALTAAEDRSIRLVARAGVRALLMLSPDERWLLRRVCVPGGLACAVDLLDVESGDVATLPDREVVGVHGDLVFATACGNAGCHLTLMDVATGDEQPIAALNGIATIVDVDGRPVVAHNSPPAGAGATGLHALDPATGESVEVLAGIAGGFVELHSNAFAFMKISGPAGWVVATVWGPQGPIQAAAVDLRDGETIPLPFGPNDAHPMGPRS